MNAKKFCELSEDEITELIEVCYGVDDTNFMIGWGEWVTVIRHLAPKLNEMLFDRWCHGFTDGVSFDAKVLDRIEEVKKADTGGGDRPEGPDPINV